MSDEQVPRPRARPAGKKPGTETTETTAKQSPPPRPPVSPPRSPKSDVELREGVKDLYDLLGMGALATGMQMCMRAQHAGGESPNGQALVQMGQTLTGDAPDQIPVLRESGIEMVPNPDMRTHSARIADEWVKMSKQNKTVRLWLTRMSEGSTAANLLSLHAPLILPFIPGVQAIFQMMPGVGASANGNGS